MLPPVTADPEGSIVSWQAHVLPERIEAAEESPVVPNT
jgi:hypothetical protein